MKPINDFSSSVVSGMKLDEEARDKARDYLHSFLSRCTEIALRRNKGSREQAEYDAIASCAEWNQLRFTGKERIWILFDLSGWVLFDILSLAWIVYCNVLWKLEIPQNAFTPVYALWLIIPYTFWYMQLHGIILPVKVLEGISLTRLFRKPLILPFQQIRKVTLARPSLLLIPRLRIETDHATVYLPLSRRGALAAAVALAALNPDAFSGAVREQYFGKIFRSLKRENKISAAVLSVFWVALLALAFKELPALWQGVGFHLYVFALAPLAVLIGAYQKALHHRERCRFALAWLVEFSAFIAFCPVAFLLFPGSLSLIRYYALLVLACSSIALLLLWWRWQRWLMAVVGLVIIVLIPLSMYLWGKSWSRTYEGVPLSYDFDYEDFTWNGSNRLSWIEGLFNSGENGNLFISWCEPGGEQHKSLLTSSYQGFGKEIWWLLPGCPEGKQYIAVRRSIESESSAPVEYNRFLYRFDFDTETLAPVEGYPRDLDVAAFFNEGVNCWSPDHNKLVGFYPIRQGARTDNGSVPSASESDAHMTMDWGPDSRQIVIFDLVEKQATPIRGATQTFGDEVYWEDNRTTLFSSRSGWQAPRFTRIYRADTDKGVAQLVTESSGSVYVLPGAEFGILETESEPASEQYQKFLINLRTMDKTLFESSPKPQFLWQSAWNASKSCLVYQTATESVALRAASPGVGRFAELAFPPETKLSELKALRSRNAFMYLRIWYLKTPMLVTPSFGRLEYWDLEAGRIRPLRWLNDLETMLIPTMGSARFPLLSPDGQMVASLAITWDHKERNPGVRLEFIQVDDSR